jgi:hypothetical protein
MSKSLTLSMSLALALGFSGASFAGHGSAGCATCGIASPQGTVVSPQSSPQGVVESCDTCAPAKKHHFKFSMPACLKPKPKMYTYEWVLKKKKVHGHHAEAACDTCGTAVTPSGQYSSPQGTYAAPQASYAAPQAYGASQSLLPTSEMKPATPAPVSPDAVPPAPAAPAPAAPAPPAPAGAQSSLLYLAPAGN